MATTQTDKCTRCGGAGTIASFRHIAGGTCFDCDGSGLESLAVVIAASKGEKRHTVVSDFLYTRGTGRDWANEWFAIYSDGSTNRGTLEECRKQCRTAIANGFVLTEKNGEYI